MTKKEYLEKLLATISPEILPISWDILLLLKKDKLDASLLETLYQILSEYIKTVSNSAQKEKLNESLSFVQKLKQIESNDKIEDQKDIDELDKALLNM